MKNTSPQGFDAPPEAGAHRRSDARHDGESATLPAPDITTEEQIECLGVPARLEILDALRVLQPCSVREMAAHLSRQVTSLYHHIDKLLAVGLVAEHGLRPTGRRPEMLYYVPHNMRMRYEPTDPANVTLVNRIAEAISRMAARDFRAGMLPGLAVASGVERNLWAARTKLWLSRDELAELNGLLARIMRLMDHERDDTRRLYALSWMLAPDPDGAPSDPAS